MENCQVGIAQAEPASMPATNNNAPEFKNGRPEEVIIRPLNHGFVVSVGCKQFALEDRKTVLSLISDYLENPKAMEERYSRGEIW